MPSEDLVQRALDALAGPREAFRMAVEAAVEEIGSRITAEQLRPEGRVERYSHELGVFAADRIDSGRFASIFAASSTLAPGAIVRLERAHERLRSIAQRSDEQFVVRVAAGASVQDAVALALAGIGRAFAAARDVELARNDRSPNRDMGAGEAGFPFRRWNRGERQIAPPLVIDVEGGDAQATALTEFMDGQQKLVLVIRGAAPAAPLVRLATAGVFVMQTTEPADLAEIANVDGPAIAALVPEGGAVFVHRPGAEESWRRFEIKHLPADSQLAQVGSFSAFQQAEDLKLLRMLSTPPVTLAPREESAGRASAAEPPYSPPADPADRLAAWLLRQAELDGAA